MKPAVYAILGLSILLGACGQLLFKGASLAHTAATGGRSEMLSTLLDWRALTGFACFFISALLWIASLRNLPLSSAYPAVAFSYILIFIGSAAFFHEAITWRHLLGAVLIVAGILSIHLP